jgi:hypothetical protein
MRSCLLLLGLCWWSQAAAAQASPVLGSIRLQMAHPYQGPLLKKAVAHTQATFEGALETAWQQGRLRTNVAAWGPLLRQVHANSWSLSFSKPDTTAVHSLRTRGYFMGPWDRKTYVVYVDRAAAFYVLSVMNIYPRSASFAVERIRPAHNADVPPVLSKSEIKRYMAHLYEELVCNQALALTPEGKVY